MEAYKKWIIIFSIIIFVSFIFIHAADNHYNRICQRFGYKKSTDYHNDMIECDNEYILQYDTIQICKEYNKWGDCTRISECYYLIEPGIIYNEGNCKELT